MKQKIFIFFLKLLEKMTGKRILYYSLRQGSVFGKTSVQSKFGFWYAGDILDTTDIAYGILNNGVVEKNETNLVVKILNKLIEDRNICFYDIGANTGYYGILAAYLGGGRIKCFSFEPLEEYLDCLKESIYLNRLEDVIIPFNLALSDRNGEGEIYGFGSGATLEKKFIGGGIGAPKRKIKIKKLDDLVSEESLGAPDFIKIDVEGHELNVLEGGKKLISESLPILFVESCYSLKEIGVNFVNNNYACTLAFFRNLGYEIFCQDGSQLIRVDENFKRDGVRMFLCLHNKKHQGIKKLTGIQKDNLSAVLENIGNPIFNINSKN